MRLALTRVKGAIDEEPLSSLSSFFSLWLVQLIHYVENADVLFNKLVEPVHMEDRSTLLDSRMLQKFLPYFCRR